MHRFSLVIAAALLLQACATTPVSPHKVVIVPQARDRLYDQYHYAPVMRVGDTVYVSGVPAWKGATYEDKIRSMFEEFKRMLTAAGADLADVVEIQTFHSQVQGSKAFNEEFERFAAIHHEYFPDNYPAWTAVGTTALLAEGAVVEMRATAVIGAGRNAQVQRVPVPAKN